MVFVLLAEINTFIDRLFILNTVYIFFLCISYEIYYFILINILGFNI